MSEPTYAGAYDSPNLRRFTSRSRIYGWHIQKVLDQIRRLVASTEPRNVLDAGCGEGYVVAWLQHRMPDVRFTGIDASRETVAYANEHFGDRGTFRIGSVYKLPFSDNSFDTVICTEVIEHLDDPLKAINELKRVARKSVIISVPLEPYFRWLNALGQRFGLSLDPGHVNYWTKRGFEDLMKYHFQNAEFSRKHVYQFMLANL